MDLQNIIDIIIAYWSIWGPSLIAIGGIILTVVKAINSVHQHIEAMKNDTTLVDVKNNTAQIINENHELIRCNKLLLDQLSRVHNYAEAKEKEKGVK